MKNHNRGRKAPTPPPAYPGNADPFAGVYPWNNNPHEEEFTSPHQPEPTPLAEIIALYVSEQLNPDEQHRQAEQAAAINNAAWERFFNSEERDPELREFNQEKQLSRVQLAKEMQRHDPALAAQADLNAQPKFIRQPVQQRVDYLRREQGDGRANAFLCNIVKNELARLDVVRDRQQTIPYRYMAHREGLDSLLILPELLQEDVKNLAVKVAVYMDMLFVDQYERIVIDEDCITRDDMLLIYQGVANEAARLCVQPPGYHALLHTGTRRSDIPYDLIPGALARLRCAQWWYRNLWRLRCEWREAQLRAVSLVHKYASVYISHDALVHKREQRRKALEYFKAHDMVNEDGDTIPMEDVVNASNSNPKHRRNEMMAAAKGLETIAELRNDCAVFYTITCPSKYHANLVTGQPNPKWNHTSPRDSSDYLVNLFSGIRKALHKRGLRWYGVRVAEPHHDGTVHWHLLCFMRRKDRKPITTIMRNFAIREDRAELGPGLGKNIKPRFFAELITNQKGTPTSYLAKYISKNIDGRGLKDTISKETGKSLKDTVENVTAWASLHRVQQFRFFGIPSRQAYRELRLLAGQQARKGITGRKKRRVSDKAVDDVLSAADAGCFATYILKQGGVLIPRKYHVVRTAYTEADKPSAYGDHGVRIYGVYAPRLGESSRICTHSSTWQIVRRASTPAVGVDLPQSVDLRDGPAVPWTRGNNCPLEQNVNNKEGVITTNEPAPPLQFDQITGKDRRALLRRIRSEPAPPKKQENPFPESTPMFDAWEKAEEKARDMARTRLSELAKARDKAVRIQDSAVTAGIVIDMATAMSLAQGGEITVNNRHYTANAEGNLFAKIEPNSARRIDKLWQHLRDAHGVQSGDIRFDPLGTYSAFLKSVDPDAWQKIFGKHEDVN